MGKHAGSRERGCAQIYACGDGRTLRKRQLMTVYSTTSSSPTTVIVAMLVEFEMNCSVSAFPPTPHTRDNTHGAEVVEEDLAAAQQVPGAQLDVLHDLRGGLLERGEDGAHGRRRQREMRGLDGDEVRVLGAQRDGAAACLAPRHGRRVLVVRCAMLQS